LIVRFVDIGGIDDHHCINFISIKTVSLVLFQKHFPLNLCLYFQPTCHFVSSITFPTPYIFLIYI